MSANQLMGQNGNGWDDVHSASRKAYGITLTAAKNMTAVAYADSLSLVGRNWLRGMGIRVRSDDWDSVMTLRMLQWNGTPHMLLSDFAECLSLIDVYNDFDPAHVLHVLSDLETRHPGMAFEYRLAREFSPAIYIRDTGLRLLDKREIKRLGKELRADEADVVFGLEHRFWFD